MSVGSLSSGTALISAFVLSSLLIGWQTVTATRADVPRPCRSGRPSLSGPRRRDWAPRASATDCGIVRTDQGTVRLPASNRLAFGSRTREALHDRLREGCAVHLRVRGWGGDLAPGAPQIEQERGTDTLRRVESAAPGLPEAAP